MKLKQKLGFRRREFELIQNTLNIKTQLLGETNEWSINVEHIGKERFYNKQSRFLLTIFGLFFFAFMIICISFYLTEENKNEALPALLFGIVAGGGIGLFCFLFPLKKELHLTGGVEQVMFFINKPSEEEMNSFIDEMIKRSNESLKTKYGEIDIDLSEETQMRNLNILVKRGIITEEQYGELRAEYKIRK